MCEKFHELWLHLTCLSQFAITGHDHPVIIEQRHQSWLLIRFKRLVKELKLIEKLRSQHQQTMRFSLVTLQHARCRLVISRVGNQARKSQAISRDFWFRQAVCSSWSRYPGYQVGFGISFSFVDVGFPTFLFHLIVRLLTNVNPLHSSLINYAFVINNIKPEQVHKCADNDSAANYHWRAEKVEAVLFLWHHVASRSMTAL